VAEYSAEFKKSIQERYDKVKSWEIDASNDYIQSMDLLKILIFSKDVKERAQILASLNTPKELYDKLPLHNPLIIKKTNLVSICNFINAIEQKAARGTFKNGQISKFKNYTTSSPPPNSNPFTEIAQINPFYFLHLHLGFQPVKGKNGRDWLQKLEEKRANGIEIVSPQGKSYLIYNTKEDKNFFLWARDESFKGGLLQFIIREVLGYPDVKNPKAKKEALEYISQRQQISLPAPSLNYFYKSQKGTDKEDAETKIYGKLEYPEYLISRGISKKTLSSTLFRGLIGNVVNSQYPNTRNVFFKMQNRYGETTYLEKNKGLIGIYQKGVSTSGMLFKSQIGTGAINTLIFAETTIDLLSKIELEKGIRKNVLYVSSNGQINSEQLEHLLDLIQQKNISYIEINQDNDLQGRIYTYKILAKIMKDSPIYEYDTSLIELEEKLSKLTSEQSDKKIELLNTTHQKMINQINHNMKSNKFIRLYTPMNKDFNEDLMAKKGLSRENIQMSVVLPH